MSSGQRYLIGFLFLLVGALARPAAAETGHDGWLRYPRLDAAAVAALGVAPPVTIVALNHGGVADSALGELERGLEGMLGARPRVAASVSTTTAFIVGTADRVRAATPAARVPGELGADGFWLGAVPGADGVSLVVAGASERGMLYGVFALLRKMALHESLAGLDHAEAPWAPQRWTNEWNNLDGSIERGYGGRSIFFADGHVRQDLTRVHEYARLLASVGINGCAVNNVNANPVVLTDAFLPELARLAAAFRPWGVRLAVAVDFGSPKATGGLDTFDPLDPRVAAFWRSRVDRVYAAIPDLGGFVLKADSEGRMGPSEYGRTHADAANVIARALAPHGGVVFYRGFVYDHHMDWRNLKNDRARAAWDNFHGLDGAFDDNVILQIKDGPIDFQAREPVSPLFGALRQDQPGHRAADHPGVHGPAAARLLHRTDVERTCSTSICEAERPGTPVRDLVAGQTFHRPAGGFVGVSNVGDSPPGWATTWRSPTSTASAGSPGIPTLGPEGIAEDWTRLTFGHDPHVVEHCRRHPAQSWPAYEHIPARWACRR